MLALYEAINRGRLRPSGDQLGVIARLGASRNCVPDFQKAPKALSGNGKETFAEALPHARCGKASVLSRQCREDEK